MWTKITRPDYERRGGRYASGLTDREWAVIEPMMPARKATGRPRTTDLREVTCVRITGKREIENKNGGDHKP